MREAERGAGVVTWSGSLRGRSYIVLKADPQPPRSTTGSFTMTDGEGQRFRVCWVATLPTTPPPPDVETWRVLEPLDEAQRLEEGPVTWGPEET